MRNRTVQMRAQGVSWTRHVVITALMVSVSLAIPAVGDEAKRPNIVFILADDLGYGDLGCYGQARIKTPNIDRLAAEGMRFTQCYAGSTVCARRGAA